MFVRLQVAAGPGLGTLYSGLGNLFSADRGAEPSGTYEMAVNGSYPPNNAGPVMYMDLVYPLILFVLLWLLQK